MFSGDLSLEKFSKIIQFFKKRQRCPFRFQFGGYKLTKQQWFAIIAAGAKTGVPPKVFKQIVKTLGAEYDFGTDEYLVDCNATKSASEIVIQLASDSWPPTAHEYRIPPSAFAANVGSFEMIGPLTRCEIIY